MSGLGYKFRGFANWSKSMDKMAKERPRAAREVHRRVSKRVLQSARRNCPVVSGTLQRTGEITEEVRGDLIRFAISFGGALAPYAVYVHYATGNLFLERAFQAHRDEVKREILAEWRRL